MSSFKEYWYYYLVIATILTGLITFGSKITVFADLPQRVNDIENHVAAYVAESRERTIRQETLIEQQGRIINLMLTRKIDFDIAERIGS